MKTERIVLLGAGNLGTHLGKALYSKGFEISQVFSRTLSNAVELASKIDAVPIDDIRSLDPISTVIIIALNDDAVPEILENIYLREQLVLHTSGSISLDVLKSKTGNCGVIYPLQTFSKFRDVNFSEIPLLIEANTKDDLNRILKISRSLSTKVHLADSEQRAKVHVSAVFACNFVNHFYAIAQLIIKEAPGFGFEILKPLILETAKKAIESGDPYKSQSGPALRGNKQIVSRHLEMLQGNPDLQNLYTFATNSIYKLYNNQNLIEE